MIDKPRIGRKIEGVKKLSTLAAVIWLSGCVVTDKRSLEYPGVHPTPDGGAALVLTPEQFQECLDGGGCITMPLDSVDPGCFFTDEDDPTDGT